MGEPWSDIYKGTEHTGLPPIAEDEAMAQLIARSGVLRRRLLAISLGGAVLGGGVAVLLYVVFTMGVRGRLAGFAFAAGGVLAFVILHRISRAIARTVEARWAGELAKRLPAKSTVMEETLSMIDG